MANPSRITPALIAFGLFAVALLIYLGVSLTSPDGPPELAGTSRPAWSDSLRFAEWDELIWKAAAEKPSLVLLLVGDPLSPESREVEAALQHDSSLRLVVVSNFLAVRVDRRARPDLALRYAENQVPHLSVLLPTGEALARITGDPETWLPQLVETGRYWRDHQDEIGGRVGAFWAEVQADSVGPDATEPSIEQIGSIDSALFQVLHNLLESDTPDPAIWRTDFDSYLGVRHTASADSLRQALKAARELRVSELNDPLDFEATPAEWAFTVIELRRQEGCDFGDSTLLKVQQWFTQAGGSATAEEEALSLRLALLLKQKPRPAYPGLWLGSDSGEAAALPHFRHRPAALDGYLMDAIAWLEFGVESGDSLLLAGAVRLGDSLWFRLWDPSRRALRDKPQVPGFLREVAVYPRAQLGRVANIFDRLANLTGESRFRSRADSCLVGFAPYARAAGAAATYYGEALLRRSQAAVPGRLPAGTAKSRGVGTDPPL